MTSSQIPSCIASRFECKDAHLPTDSPLRLTWSTDVGIIVAIYVLKIYRAIADPPSAPSRILQGKFESVKKHNVWPSLHHNLDALQRCEDRADQKRLPGPAE